MSSRKQKGEKFSSPDQFDPARIMHQFNSIQDGRMGVDIKDRKMEALQLFDTGKEGHRYTVMPVNYMSDTQAMQKLQTIFGVPIGETVDFEPERFDLMRSRVMGIERKEKRGAMMAFHALHRSRTAKAFRDNAATIDHAAFEKLLYPKFLPTHKELCQGLGLKPQMWYSPSNYTELETISRMALDGVTIQKEGDSRKRIAKFSFEEFYSLFWGYYNPFNLPAFLHHCTDQSSFFCVEFINAFADYLVERLQLLKKKYSGGGGVDHGAPIVLLGPKTGQLARFLNGTKKLPVEVLACCEDPVPNPYSLIIPNEVQHEFKVYPVEKIKKWEHALEKYKPSIVLTQELKADHDDMQILQKFGHVREYLHVGIPRCFLEGQGWDTWGIRSHDPEMKVYKETKRRADKPTAPPPYEMNGFKMRSLPHLSKWLAYKLDSDIAQGTGGVTSWCRTQISPGFFARKAYGWSWRFRK